MKAKPIPDNSPEGRLRRARIVGEKQWAAIVKVADASRARREAEITAMPPEERIAARLVESREADVYEVLYPFIMEAGDAWEEKMKDPAFARRVERALSNARRLRTDRLHAEEDRAAGLIGPTPTGRMSKPMTRKAIQSLVRARYPRDTVNLDRWWERRIVKAGIVVDAEHYRAVRIDLGQLRTSLPLLTEADIAPHLAA